MKMDNVGTRTLWICLVINFLFTLPLAGQNAKSDSLQTVYYNSTDARERADAVMALARTFRRQHPSYDSLYQLAMHTADSADYASGSASSRYSLARGHLFRAKDYDKGLAYAREAQRIYEQMSLDDRKNERTWRTNSYRSYLLQSELHLASEDRSAALEISSRLEEMIVAPLDSTFLSSFYRHLAFLYQSVSASDLSLNYALKAVKIAEAMNMGRSQINPIYFNLAIAYTATADYQLARETYQKLLISYNEEPKDYRSMAVVYARMADVMTNEESAKTNEAERDYRQALQQVETGLLYLDSANLSALKPGFMNLKAQLLNYTGDIEAAYELMKYLQGTSIWRNITHKQETYRIFALFESKKGRHQRAIRYLDSVSVYAEKVNTHMARAWYTKTGVEVYSNMGDYKTALDFRDRNAALNDSLKNDSKTKEIESLKIIHETEKKDQTISLQEAQISLAEETENKLFAQRTGLIAGSGLLLVVSFLFYRNARIKAKSNAIISTQKDAIEKSLRERETLLKEIHHRVKNNLQVVASLLHLQSGNTDNEHALKVLEEGQGRVRSMALIHQKLYENERLENISFKEYLGDLTREIQASFGEKARDIRIDIDSENVSFDVDTAIPLGLIINELLTNAFKHAFDNVNEGQLNIKLGQKSSDANTYELKVKDNGKGFSGKIDFKKTKSLGLRLIRVLSHQLEGIYNFSSNEGTEFTLTFYQANSTS